ncbi:zinc finger lsd1 subclass family protein, partial (macronuclear) [Tetrahymena thermophila SB210]
MQFKNIQFIWTVILANLVYGAEKLVVSQLNGLFSRADVSWVSNSVFICGATDYTDFSSSSVLGVFGLNNNVTQNTFNLPPHWSFSVRFDLILSQSLDTNPDDDTIFVKIEGVTDKFQKVSAGGGYKLCTTGTSWGDELVLYYRNFTHNSPSTTIKLESKTNEDITNEGYALKNFYLFVDTCHDTCLTCNGPAANQCLSCPSNSDQSGSTCQCKSGYYAQNNSCIRSCSSGFKQDATGQFCVLDFCDKAKCKSCDNVLDICTDCLSGLFLIDGQCVDECPSYSTASGSICEDLKSKTSNGVYLLKSMFDTNFGESEVQGAGITIEGFQGFNNKESGALTTSCGGKSLLGGAYLSSEKAIITSTLYSGLDPHWSVVIGYTLYKIDSWSSESVQLFVDNKSRVSTVRSESDGDSNICGRLSKKDQIIKVSKNITHSSSTLQFNIKSYLRGDSFTKSFGIRELYILVDYCSSNCKECNASGCVKCNSTYYLYNSQCILACPDGYTSDSDNTCQACHSTCLTCSSPSSTSCLTCRDNNYLNPDRTCKESCPSQFWGDDSKWQCKQCDAPCYNCQNPGNSNSCTSCSGTLYLLGNQCSSDCPAHTFKLTQTFNNICQTCHSSCKTCDGATSNNCLSCEAPDLFYQKGSKTCSDTCQLNQFKNTSNQECTSCHTTCASCSGPQNNQCLSCSGALFLFENQCIPDCPENYFKNTLNNQCTLCHANCLTCNGSGSNNCLSCSPSSLLDLSSHQCVSECSSNQYSDTILNQCKQCDSTCLTCDGSGINSCLSCLGPNLFYQADSKSCVTICRPNQFQDAINQLCSSCDPSCKTCSGPSSSNCLTCSRGLILHDNECINSCPEQFYYDVVNDICSPCNSKCLTCSGSGSDNCLSCKLNTYLDPSTHRCVEGCNKNQYIDHVSKECKQCDILCKTCYGPDSNNCLSCEGPDLFYQEIFKKCVQDCDKNQYKNEVNQTCSTCDPQCATCFGPGSNNCLSCPRNLILSLGQCVEVCPVSYYKNSDINECLPCDPTCQNCDGPLESNCTECPQGLLLQENKCVSKCDDSYYVNPFSSICQKCDSSCQTCFGPSESECSSCALDLIYLNNSCLNECPKNYFTVQQTDVLECFECHRYCQLGCSGPLKEDCDQIKYQYQIVIFIFVAKSILWIVSSVIGYFLDKRQSKTFNSIIKSPRYVSKSEKVSKISLKQEDDKQEDSQQQEEQSQNIEELQNELENQQNQKQNNLEDVQNLNFLEQIMQSHITTKKIKPRKKFQNSQRSIQILEYQQTNLESNHHSQTKMSSLCFPTIGTIQNFNKTNNQQVVDNQGQDNQSSQQQAYLANNKFKFTILGNEWVSLFYFYDQEVSRVTRAILIFLKYQAFFLSSELVYSVLKTTQEILLKKSMKFLSVIFFTLILSSSLYIAFWFAPQLQNLYLQKDKAWSLYVGLLLICDFFILQQVLSFIQYIFTIKYLNSLQ